MTKLETLQNSWKTDATQDSILIMENSESQDTPVNVWTLISSVSGRAVSFRSSNKTS